MKTRMHPSIILENIISYLAIIVIIGYSFAMQMISDLPNIERDIAQTSSFISGISSNIFLIGLLLFIFVLMIFTTYFFFVWKNTYLYFEKNKLIIEKGKLFKRITTIHLSDIASINIKRNILEKTLGTSNLKIELNMNAENSFRSKLVFKEEKANEIRNSILESMGKTEKEEIEEFESVIDFTPKDVFRHMWLSVDITSIIILAATYLVIIMIAGKKALALGFVLGLISILIIVLPILFSFIKSYCGYHNFKVRRDGNDIKLSYGLFTTYKYNLPINRINAVILRQTLQARILGYTQIEVVNAGLGSEQEEKTIISLYVKDENKNIILNEIIPEYKNEITLNSQPTNALSHYISGKSLLIVIALCAAPFTYYLTLLTIPLLILIAYGQYKLKKIGCDKNMLVIQNCLINKKTYFLKLEKLEIIKIERHLLSFIFNTYSLQTNVVGPPANSTFISGLFDEVTLNNVVNTYMGETNEN